MAFQRAAKKDEIPAGEIRELQLGDTTLALARVGDNFFAINGICLHQGGPIGEGQLTGETVSCPWHGWTYDVTTGTLTQDPSQSVACYKVEIRGDEVFVDVG
ncbi:MAG TPA: Rieske 2Fe-2S domain-containing protein [Candidatus Acidoferrales bacterium]|nr:Rieske 2Fe-2S domain-containing protein [Candidatus Acidoferrales bacterium]